MDYKPPPEEAVPTFHEGNMGWTLCKEIAIVVTEMLEDFNVKLDLVAIEWVWRSSLIQSTQL